MDEEERRIMAQQIREELERMDPDINEAVHNQFGGELESLSKAEQGTWGNVKASDEDPKAPPVDKDQQQSIAANFEERRDDLNNRMDAFRGDEVNRRKDFLLDTYLEQGTDEDRQAVAGLLLAEQGPPGEEPVDDGAGQEVVEVAEQPADENLPGQEQEDESFYGELTDFGNEVEGGPGDLADHDYGGGYEPDDLTTEFNDCAGPPGNGGGAGGGIEP